MSDWDSADLKERVGVPGYGAASDAYSRGHRDARMAVDTTLREVGLGGLDRGSLGDIQVDIRRAASRIQELEKALAVVDDDMSRDRDHWQARAERAEAQAARTFDALTEKSAFAMLAEREACARLANVGDCCAHCLERWPTCVGRYEDDGPPEAACDECCGHGNEDGQCVPVATFIAAAIRARKP